MIHPAYRWGLLYLALLAPAVGGLLPTATAANPIRAFRNDTGMAIYIQSAVTVRPGVVAKGRLIPLPVGQMVRDPITSNIIIYIYDPRQRLLYTNVLLASATDQFFSIQMDTPLQGPGGVPIPRAKLVPIKSGQ